MTTKPVANIAAFVKHASRYGTDGVMEGAHDCGLTFADLIELQKECDALDDARQRRPAARRLTAEERVRRLLGLPEEGEA